MRLRAHWGLSSGQTIGAARTAVRSACCLPELRVANRLRRLCPLGDGELFKFYLKSSVCQRQTGLPKGNPPCVFPTFPPAPLRIANRNNRAPHRAASPALAPESEIQRTNGAELCPRWRTHSSKILPSVEIVTTFHGINFPLCCKAAFAARSSPPQQGTSMRTTVTLRMSFCRRISVSLSE